MNHEDWQKAFEPVPKTLATRVNFTLERLEKSKAPRFSLRTCILAVLVTLALVGTALAVAGRMGLLEYLTNGYGGEKTIPLGARDMVQSEFEHSTVQLGDVKIQIREILCDGINAGFTVAFETPPGTFALPGGDRPLLFEGEQLTGEKWEEVDKAYPVKYVCMLPYLCYVEGGVNHSGNGSGYEGSNEAPNVAVIVGVCDVKELMKLGPMSISVGVFQQGEREKGYLSAQIPLDLGNVAKRNRVYRFDGPFQAGDTALSDVAFTFSPMKTYVDYTASKTDDSIHLRVQLLDEGMEKVEDGLVFVAVNGWESFDPPPSRLYLEVEEYEFRINSDGSESMAEKTRTVLPFDFPQ